MSASSATDGLSEANLGATFTYRTIVRPRTCSRSPPGASGCVMSCGLTMVRKLKVDARSASLNAST